ncbi:MAG: hypothetical protein AAFU64_12665 [Bacteroidota bacterium]
MKNQPDKILLVLLFSALGLQVTFAQQSRYDIVYQVQLAAYKDDVQWEKYRDLKDLGFVSTQSIQIETPNDALVRVYLGKYLGLKTINHVLDELDDKGFDDMDIIKDTYKLKNDNGLNLVYTIQLGIFKKLDVQKFVDIPDLENLHIIYENKQYKLIYGFFENEEDASISLKNIEAEGYPGIVKKFR